MQLEDQLLIVHVTVFADQVIEYKTNLDVICTRVWLQPCSCWFCLELQSVPEAQTQSSLVAVNTQPLVILHKLATGSTGGEQQMLFLSTRDDAGAERDYLEAAIRTVVQIHVCERLVTSLSS